MQTYYPRSPISTLFTHYFPEPTADGAGCWHEPIYNHTLVEVDLQIPNIGMEQVSHQELSVTNRICHSNGNGNAKKIFFLSKF